jgi:hypothetical protein
MINFYICHCKQCRTTSTHTKTFPQGGHIESKCGKCGRSVKSSQVIDRLDGTISGCECPDCKTQTLQQRYITPANRTNLLCLECGCDRDLDTKEVLQKGSATGSGCFIATACYGSAEAQPVKTLRLFRDRRLMPSPIGAALVAIYYRLSPPVAEMLRSRPWARRLVIRLLIDPVVTFVRSRQ